MSVGFKTPYTWTLQLYCTLVQLYIERCSATTAAQADNIKAMAGTESAMHEASWTTARRTPKTLASKRARTNLLKKR